MCALQNSHYLAQLFLTFLLIDEKLCLHEVIFSSNPLKLSHLVVNEICFFNFLGKQSNLLLHIFQLLLNDRGMAGQLMDILFQKLNGFGKLPQVIPLGVQLRLQLAILLLQAPCLIPCNHELTHIHHQQLTPRIFGWFLLFGIEPPTHVVQHVNDLNQPRQLIAFPKGQGAEFEIPHFQQYSCPTDLNSFKIGIGKLQCSNRHASCLACICAQYNSVCKFEDLVLTFKVSSKVTSLLVVIASKAYLNLLIIYTYMQVVLQPLQRRLP